MYCVCLDYVLFFSASTTPASQIQSLRLIGGYLTLPTLHVSLPGVLSRIPSSAMKSQAVIIGGRRCRSSCTPKYERAQSQCASQEGAALGPLNSYTPWIQILLLYPVPYHFPLSSTSFPQTFILFYFFNSHLFGRSTYCNVSKQSYTFISFNLSGLFVEEGRDSNRGETRSKGIKQGLGRRVRKGIQRGEVNTNSHLRSHMETYHCGSFLQYIHTRMISKWNHQITGRHLSTSSESSSARNGLHPTELLAKGVPWKPQNNTSYCQWYWLLSTNWWLGHTAEDNWPT